jgi:hypothetical protein
MIMMGSGMPMSQSKADRMNVLRVNHSNNATKNDPLHKSRAADETSLLPRRDQPQMREHATEMATGEIRVQSTKDKAQTQRPTENREGL